MGYKMSVPEFLDEFIMEKMDIEVHLVKGNSSTFTYIGSPTNFDAFIKHMEHFKDTEVVSVSVIDGKLIVLAC